MNIMLMNTDAVPPCNAFAMKLQFHDITSVEMDIFEIHMKLGAFMF